MKKIIILRVKRGGRTLHKVEYYASIIWDVILNVITTVINTTIKITERLAKDKSCCERNHNSMFIFSRLGSHR